MATAEDVFVVAETRSHTGVIITVRHNDHYYRIPLEGLTPDFEPVNPDDTIVGPVVFTKEMEKTYTDMTRAGESGPDLYSYQTTEDVVLLCFYRQVYGLPDGVKITFREANEAAIRSGGNYPKTAADVIPAAEYHWAKAAAEAWRRIKQELGQSDDLFAKDTQPKLV